MAYGVPRNTGGSLHPVMSIVHVVVALFRPSLAAIFHKLNLYTKVSYLLRYNSKGKVYSWNITHDLFVSTPKLLHFVSYV